MPGRHDDSGHGGRETQVPKVEGKEGKETSRGAGVKKVKCASQSHSTFYIPLLVFLHCCLCYLDSQSELQFCDVANPDTHGLIDKR